MQNNSIKKNYLHNLITSLNMINDFNETNTKVEEITFLTSYGMIVGKLYDIQKYKSNTLEELKEEITQNIKKSGAVNALNIAEWLTTFQSKETSTNDIDETIILKDVNIYNENSEPIKTEYLILFMDQVIGVVPTKATIE